jgi:KaiC/GvpD/RAD55 family RecA-like ATPase
MDTAKHGSPADMHLSKAIDTAVDFSRKLWKLAFMDNTTIVSEPDRLGYQMVLQEKVVRWLLDDQEPWFKQMLETKKLYGMHNRERIWFLVDIFNPVVLAVILFADKHPAHIVRYFVLHNIRCYYRRVLSSELAHEFALLARHANGLRAAAKSAPTSSKRYWRYHDQLRPLLEAALAHQQSREIDVGDTVDLFTECCRAVGYIKASYRTGYVDFRTIVDTEFLITNLFGMATDIRGFDDLFGGGGLILTEDIPSARAHPKSIGGLGGRTILIKGRYGTGKTLLALKLAAEVARRGGIAWIMPLEQSIEECLYTLESTGALPDPRVAVIITDVFSLDQLRRQAVSEHGTLVILRTIKNSYDKFLAAFKENAKLMEECGYTLRLIVADPVNSISRHDASDDLAALRADTLQTIDEIGRRGTNVLLVYEEGQHDDALFEQNIADTVVRLSVNDRYGYMQRLFEILKSRFQREHRGEHAFSIKPGAGITIFPSSPSVMSRIRSRDISQHNQPIQFGLAALDDILNGASKSLMHGDVIVVQGPEGSYKTMLGLLFLQGVQPPPPSRSKPEHISLLIATRDDENTVAQMIKQVGEYTKNNATTIWICTLPFGYVEPGMIIQTIEDQFTKAQRLNKKINRVMIDDLAHWEMSSPLVQADLVFGDTLVEIMRRRKVTCIFLCGDMLGERLSSVQRPILDNADCMIQLARYVFGGVPKIMLQVVKTRSMRHLSNAFELTLDRQGLRIRSNSSLLRIGSSGEISSVPVRLFLHAETDMQERYNLMLQNRIRSSLSRETELEAEDRIDIGIVRVLGAASVVDELQVLQIDECQLGIVSTRDALAPALHVFSETLWKHQAWQNLLPRLEKRVRLHNNDFFAVPFYENVSLLAYRKDKIGPDSIASWEALVQAQEQWCAAHDPDSVFFDFPGSSDENYNCFFLEILFSLRAPNPAEKYNLLDWFRDPLVIRASALFRHLCRAAYLRHHSKDSDQHREDKRRTRSLLDITVEPSAVVWRHWYSTANQMLANLDLATRQQIAICPLPGSISIAGEWYLGIPAYSAAPDVGIAIIESMTSRSAEMERLRMGVGLPVRKGYYHSEETEGVDSLISPYFSMERETLRQLIDRSIRRSDCEKYAQLSSQLAGSLRRIIEISDDDPDLDGKITNVFRDLEASIAFLS